MAFIGSILLLGILYFVKPKAMKIKIRKNGFFTCYGLFLFIFFLNFLGTPQAAKYAFYEYILYMFMFFAIAYASNYIDFEWIFNAYILLGVIDSLEAIWEFSTGHILYRSTYTGEQLIRRAFGLVGSPLTLAMLLCCTTLIAFYFMLIKSKKYAIPFGINVIGVLSTQSRGPIIAMCLGMIVIYYMTGAIKDKNRARSFLKRVCIIILIIFAGFYLLRILSVYSAFLANIYNRMQTIVEWGSSNATNYERSNRWSYAFELFKSYPLLGYGVSSTGSHASTGIVTESGVLKILAETGIVGSISYFGMLYFGTIKQFRRCSKNRAFFLPMVMGIVFAIFFENIILQILESATIFFILSICMVYLTKEYYSY